MLIRFNALVVVAAQIFRQLATAATFIVTAHAVSPQSFGVIALGMVIVNFFVQWSDLAYEPIIARSTSDVAARIARNALMRVGIVSLAISLFLALLAGPLATLLGSAPVQDCVVSIAWIVIFTGLAGVLRGTCSATGRFFPIALSEVSAAVLACIAAIILAERGYGILALEAQVLLSNVIVTIILAFSVGQLIAKSPNGDANNLSFAKLPGIGFAGFAAVNYWARNVDNLLVGRFLGAMELGLYERAYTLMYVPATQVSAALGRVIVPRLSENWSSQTDLESTYMRAVTAIGMTVFPGLLFISVTSYLLVPIVFGANWLSMASILAPLALAGSLQALSGTVGWIYQAAGDGWRFMRNGLLLSAVNISGIAIGVAWGSAVDVARIYTAITILLFWPIIMLGVGPSPMRVIAVGRGLIPIVVPGLLGWLITYIVSESLRFTPELQLTVLATVFCVVFFGLKACHHLFFKVSGRIVR